MEKENKIKALKKEFHNERLVMNNNNLTSLRDLKEIKSIRKMIRLLASTVDYAYIKDCIEKAEKISKKHILLGCHKEIFGFGNYGQVALCGYLNFFDKIAYCKECKANLKIQKIWEYLKGC